MRDKLPKIRQFKCKIVYELAMSWERSRDLTNIILSADTVMIINIDLTNKIIDIFFNLQVLTT